MVRLKSVTRLLLALHLYLCIDKLVNVGDLSAGWVASDELDVVGNHLDQVIDNSPS